MRRKFLNDIILQSQWALYTCNRDKIIHGRRIPFFVGTVCANQMEAMCKPSATCDMVNQHRCNSFGGQVDQCISMSTNVLKDRTLSPFSSIIFNLQKKSTTVSTCSRVITLRLCPNLQAFDTRHCGLVYGVDMVSNKLSRSLRKET